MDSTNTEDQPVITWKLELRDLTDEEIKELWNPLPDTKTYDSDILKFARAILRKAQEHE